MTRQSSGDLSAEAALQAVRRGAAVADLSARGRVELQGADRAKLLHNLCTQDVAGMAPGHGREAFFLDAKGKIVDFARLFMLEGSTWLDLAPGRAAPIIKHLDRYIIREDVKLVDQTPLTSQLHVVGPKAAELLDSLGASVPDATPLSTHETSLGGVPVQLRGVARSLYPGWDVIALLDQSEKVKQCLANAGEALGLAELDDATMEFLRVEAGIPEFGVDFSGDNLAQELDRNETAISFVKGCYLGQETVARLDAMGHVNRILRGVRAPAGAELVAGSPLKLKDKDVGVISSAARSPETHESLGLAILRLAANPGATVDAITPAGVVPATVCSLPFTRETS